MKKIMFFIQMVSLAGMAWALIVFQNAPLAIGCLVSCLWLRYYEVNGNANP